MTSNIISASSPRPLPPTNATFNFFSFFLFRQRHLQPSRAPLRDLHRAARCLCGLGFTKNRECLRSCSCSSVRLGWRCVEIGQTPPLPADKARAIGRLGVGHFTKVTLQFAAPFWNPESHTLRYVHFHTRVCLSPSALCISCRIVAWAVQRPRTRNNEHPPLVGPRPATDPPAPVCANDADAPVSFFLPPSRSFSRSLFSLPLPCASPSPGSTTPKKKEEIRLGISPFRFCINLDLILPGIAALEFIATGSCGQTLEREGSSAAIEAAMALLHKCFGTKVVPSHAHQRDRLEHGPVRDVKSLRLMTCAASASVSPAPAPRMEPPPLPPPPTPSNAGRIHQSRRLERLPAGGSGGEGQKT